MSYYGTPPNMRVKITHEDGAMVIITPFRKMWVQTLFLLVWLGGWLVGEIFALTSLFRILSGRENPAEGFFAVGGFLAVWLTFWTIGGFFALYQVLIRLAGKQVIRVTDFQMSVSKRLLGIPFGKEIIYESALVRDLRASDSALPENIELPAVISRLPFQIPGYLLFNFGAEEVKLEMPNGEEAKAVCELIKGQYRVYEDEEETGVW